MAVKRPNSRRNLDMALRRQSNDNDGYVRMRTLIANAIVAQMMLPGAVKGGSALKIRFGDRSTRATSDLDAARSTDLDKFVNDFSEQLAIGWEGFSARLVERQPASPEGVPTAYVMRPFDIKLSYLGSPWCTVVFELGHDEIGDAEEPDYIIPSEASDLLESMGFPPLAPVPLMPLHHQIAQKLHGATEANSMRAHDLVDLQLIVARGTVDWELTRQTCIRLFAYRQAHAWPPQVVSNKGWTELYKEQALGLEVLPTVEEAVQWANELIMRINRGV